MGDLTRWRRRPTAVAGAPPPPVPGVVSRRRPDRGAAGPGPQPPHRCRRGKPDRDRLVRVGRWRRGRGDGGRGVSGTLATPLPRRPGRPYLSARGRARAGLGALGRHRREGAPEGHRVHCEPRRPTGQRLVDPDVARRRSRTGQGGERSVRDHGPARRCRSTHRLGAQPVGGVGSGDADHRYRR